MILHLALTGSSDAAKEPVRHEFDRPGVTLGEEWSPLAEGRQRFPTRAQVAEADEWWADRLRRTTAERGRKYRVWALDLEMLGEGPTVRRDWMAGRIAIDRDMATYLGAARAAAHHLGTPEGGFVLPADAEVVWILLPQLIGPTGLPDYAMDFASSLLNDAHASRLAPSFRPRRLIGNGITASAQRRRVAVGYAQMADRFGPDMVIPELCPTFYDNGSISPVPDQDTEAMIRGLVDAGCPRAVVWAQAEPSVASIIARHCRVFARGVARARQPEPR